MTGKESDASKVIPVALTDLTEDQKRQVEQSVQDFQKLCLESFSMTRLGPIQKTQLPSPSFVAASSSQIPIEPQVNIQEAVHKAVHRALLNQSGVLVNTLHNLIKQTVDESIT